MQAPFWRNYIMLRYNLTMSKRQWLIVFGILLIILPFLGLPSFFKQVLLTIIGAATIFIAYQWPGQKLADVHKSQLPFSEHKNSNE